MCCVQDICVTDIKYKGNESFPELQEGVLDLHAIPS